MTMSVSRLAAAVLLALVLTAGVGSAAATDDGPNGLRAFLFRADDPPRSSFARTPSFAWSPVPGADHYQFQLSTSDAFRDNAVIWEAKNLQSPVAAPAISLPWITGSPHSLYARVRAILSDGSTSDWSDDLGFDVVPPAAPKPLKSAPGLLRWSPVEGADYYQVWLIDAKKFEFTFGNVLDEREFYTFHQTATWIGSVRWRVRAFRADMLGRFNGVPVSVAGTWSPIYVSSNPAVNSAPDACKPVSPDDKSCPIALGDTISDVVSDGDPSDPSHRLMPAFTWTGNETLTGTPAELFRVYVFTDKQCLNRVFTGSVVGSPAYAARPYGPLALPTASVASARSSYLVDGSEPLGLTYDGDSVKTSESGDAAKPTVTLPLVKGATTPGKPGQPPSETQSAPFLDWGDSKFGAPIDLWDTNWPNGGYYWTVVPVAAVSPGALQTTVATPGGIAGASSLPVANSDGFAVGDQITVGSGGNNESLTITSVDPGSLSFATALTKTHGVGEPVSRTGGSIRYVDLELAQDACAAGRLGRFGVSSEPVLTGGGDPFVSGLSGSGKLTSARRSETFYRPPLVAWTPALRSLAYQVQWSKTKYPFVPESDPASGAAGILTGSTSVVLPLTTGTWYYRVRGYDYGLPTNSQQMGWSDPAKIVIAKPTFTIVGSSSGSQSTKKKSSKKPRR
jgi:hypothetical protein